VLVDEAGGLAGENFAVAPVAGFGFGVAHAIILHVRTAAPTRMERRMISTRMPRTDCLMRVWRSRGDWLWLPVRRHQKQGLDPGQRSLIIWSDCQDWDGAVMLFGIGVTWFEFKLGDGAVLV